MASKLYVEGFPASLSDEELANLFSAFGTVISAAIARTITGESLCFAEVAMAQAEEADEAIKVLHHARMDGKLILIFQDLWPDSTTERAPASSSSRPKDSMT
jgi:RNA recognition motif-containing protein